MTKCSVLQCGARKNKNRPQLTLHSLPKNEDKKNKWLDIIGRDNINPHQGKIFICSLHFDPSYFNKTLDVIRLRDDAVPLPFVVERKNNAKPVLIEQQNKQGSFQEVAISSNLDYSVAETALVKAQDNISTLERRTLVSSSTFVIPSMFSATPQDISTLERHSLCEKRRKQDSTLTSDMSTFVMPSTSSAKVPNLLSGLDVKTNMHPNHNASYEKIRLQANKIKQLKMRCNAQKGIIKNLKAKVRRREKKIAVLSNMII